MPVPRITSVHPLRAVEGGVITIRGEDLLGEASISSPPNITLGDIVPVSYTHLTLPTNREV